jgi:PIN domain nuclease of toxin-antitoxin system
MSYLLDTHVILWMLDEVENLSDKVQAILVDSKNKCYFSPISLLEIAIKKNIGKLTTEKSIETHLIGC